MNYPGQSAAPYGGQQGYGQQVKLSLSIKRNSAGIIFIRYVIKVVLCRLLNRNRKPQFFVRTVENQNQGFL